MSLTIALATRGRPGLLKKTLERTLPNIRLKDTQLVVLCDDDDALTQDMQAVVPECAGTKQLFFHSAPRPDSVGAKFNRVVKVSPADVYMVMVDYVAHVTPGFDEKILEAASIFPDGIGVVYNHMANISFPFLNAPTAKLVEKMGGIYPEHFPYWFIDHWLDDIVRMIDRISVADVHVSMDFKPPTQNMREPAFWATVFDAMALDRRKIAWSIIDGEDFQEAPWRKLLMKRMHVLIEERSLLVNRIVKGMAGLTDKPDAGYERIRARAVETMKRCIGDLEEQERIAA